MTHSLNKKPFIIAEIGVNHNGSISIAKKIIDKLEKINVTAIKFQYFVASELVDLNTKSAPYQQINSSKKNQYSMLKSLELSFDQILELRDYTKRKKVEFLCSFFSESSLNKFIRILNLKYLKIPSGEINNIPYLRNIGKLNKKVFLSTGMSSFNEIKFAINTLIKSGTFKNNITVLQCTSSYPTPDNQINLNNLKYFKSKLKTNVGLSDHSQGSMAAVIGLGMGCSVFEKHVTLNKNLKGPDHRSSLNIREFKAYMNDIDRANIMMGNIKKNITKNEMKNIYFIRKSIYAKKNINKNEKFSKDNLILKRPAAGLSPLYWDKLLKRKAKKNYKKNSLIKI